MGLGRVGHPGHLLATSLQQPNKLRGSWGFRCRNSGGATPGRARSNDLAGRFTALAQDLPPPCLALGIALLR